MKILNSRILRLKIIVILIITIPISCKQNSETKILSTNKSKIEYNQEKINSDNTELDTIKVVNFDTTEKNLSDRNHKPKMIIEKRIDTITFINPDSLFFTKNIYKLKEKKSDFNYDGENSYWFTNKSENQIIIFGFATDYHRVLQAIFDKENLHPDFFNHISFSKRQDTIINVVEKTDNIYMLKDTISHYIKMNQNQTVKYLKKLKPKKLNIIDNKFFMTRKGIKIGININKVIKYYGLPDSTNQNKSVKELYWKFLPFFANSDNQIFKNQIIVDCKENMFDIEKINDKKSIYYNKPVMLGVYYPEIYMYFKKNKLIGMILLDGVP